VGVSSILSLGSNSSIGILYFKSKKNFNREKTIWTSFFTLLLVSVLLLILGVIFSALINKVFFSNTQLESNIILALISASLMVIEVPLLYRLQFEEKQIEFVILSLSYVFLSLGLKAIFIIYYSLGIEGFFLSEILSRLIITILYIRIIYKWTPFKIDKSKVRPLLKIGIPMIPGFFFTYFIQQGGTFFIQEFQGLNTVGIYSSGYNIGYSILLIVSSISTAWYPYFMSFAGKQSEAKIVFGAVTKYYVLFVGFIVLLYFLLAKSIVFYFIDSAYYESYKIVGIIAAAYFISGLGNFFKPYFFYKEKIFQIIIYQMIGSAVFLLCSCFLVPMYGMMGAATSIFIGMTTISLLLFIHSSLFSDFKVQYSSSILLVLLLLSGLCVVTFLLYDVESIIADIFCIVILMIYIFLSVNNLRKDSLLVKKV
jgi:O-antigen/teichoic acid export membrane protein